MKYRNITKPLLVAALLCSGTAQAGPAAEQASRLAVRGVQSFMAGQPERFDPVCVQAMPDDVLVDAIAPLLEARLAASELQELDAFYGSELGQRFNDDIAAQKTNPPGHVPATFSEAEKRHVGDLIASPAGSTYFAVISSSNPELAGKVQELLRPHIVRCMRAP